MNNKEYKHQWYMKHKKLTIARAKIWEQDNKLYLKDRRRKIKIKVFRWLGGCVCVDCGMNDIDVLSIDHINGDGQRDRNSKKCGGDAMYKKLYSCLRKGRSPPVDLEVVCRNCNWKRYLTKKRDNG